MKTSTRKSLKKGKYETHLETEKILSCFRKYFRGIFHSILLKRVITYNSYFSKSLSKFLKQFIFSKFYNLPRHIKKAKKKNVCRQKLKQYFFVVRMQPEYHVHTFNIFKCIFYHILHLIRISFDANLMALYFTY